jgi:hypothetical protein
MNIMTSVSKEKMESVCNPVKKDDRIVWYNAYTNAAHPCLVDYKNRGVDVIEHKKVTNFDDINIAVEYFLSIK